MTSREVLQECCKEGWIPLIVWDNEDGVTIIPSFSSEQLCVNWLKRNLPKEWVKGAVTLSQDDLIKMRDELGWMTMEFEWPRKMKELVELRTEVYEFAGEFETKLSNIPR